METWQKIVNGAVAVGISGSLQADVCPVVHPAQLEQKQPSFTLLLDRHPVRYKELLFDTRITNRAESYSENTVFTKEEQEASYKQLSIIEVGGLFASTPPVFHDELRKQTEGLHATIHTVIPENPEDPEVDTAVNQILFQIKEAQKRDEKVYLLGYSHGARLVFHALAATVNPSHPQYDPTLKDQIMGVALLAGRPDLGSIGDKRPGPNYRKAYTNDPPGTKEPKDCIPPDVSQKVFATYRALTMIFFEDGDGVVPPDNTQLLADQFGIKPILIVLPGDNHFGKPESVTLVGKRMKLRIQAWNIAEQIKDRVKKRKSDGFFGNKKEDEPYEQPFLMNTQTKDILGEVILFQQDKQQTS